MRLWRPAYRPALDQCGVGYGPKSPILWRPMLSSGIWAENADDCEVKLAYVKFVIIRVLCEYYSKLNCT